MSIPPLYSVPCSSIVSSGLMMARVVRLLQVGGQLETCLSIVLHVHKLQVHLELSNVLAFDKRPGSSLWMSHMTSFLASKVPLVRM